MNNTLLGNPPIPQEHKILSGTVSNNNTHLKKKCCSFMLQEMKCNKYAKFG